MRSDFRTGRRRDVPRRSSRGRGAGGAGFVLIEVLAAVVIAGLALVTLADVFGSVRMAAVRATRDREALMVALSLIAEARGRTGVPEAAAGRTANGMDWTVTVDRIDASAIAGGTEERQKDAAHALYRLTAEVAAGAGRITRLEALIARPAGR